MAGESDREKKANAVQSQLGNLYSTVGSAKTDVTNRFNNYSDPFGYNSMNSQLERMLGLAKQDIERNTAGDIARYNKGVAGRFASQGIGGTMAEEAMRAGATDIAKQKVGALSNLGQFGAGKNIDLMNMANQSKFRTTQAATDVDMNNIRNLFQKYGLMSGITGQQQSNLQNFSDDTWFDSVLGTLNMAGGLLNPISTLISPPETNYFFGTQPKQ